MITCSFSSRLAEVMTSGLCPLALTALASASTVSIASEKMTSLPEVFFAGSNSFVTRLSLKVSNLGSCEFLAQRSQYWAMSSRSLLSSL